MDTPWWSFLPDEAREDTLADVVKDLPVKRVGKPGDVAEAIVYLIGASCVTGTILPVDGGFTVA